MNYNGIDYIEPTVVLLQDTGIGVSEFAARTCYDSFESSENDSIKVLDALVTGANEYAELKDAIDDVNDIEGSELLKSLAWTHFHFSILEHANLSFLIRGTSRAVLQEHARHRIQSISVRSTRYTMSPIINAFIASTVLDSIDMQQFFTEQVLKLNLYVTTDDDYNKLSIQCMFQKLQFQYNAIGREAFLELAVAKSSLPFLDSNDAYAIFKALQDGKNKRNVGDSFKHIVDDNWRTDMVVTFNIRSLKNYFGLRDSGAAYFQIRTLAQKMKEATPDKYLKLIVKS